MRIGLGKHFINTSLGRYSDEGSELAFVPIHKNAHTWGVDFFSINYGFKRIQDLTIDRQKDLRYIVFLRDPIERWYSGATQYLIDNFYSDVPDDSDMILNKDMIKLMYSAVRLDAHTDLQRGYIMDLNIMDIYFFNIDESMFYFRFTRWLNNSGKNFKLKKLEPYDKHLGAERINQSTDSKLKLSLIKQLRQASADNPQYLTNLRNFYRPDYDLLHWMYQFNYTKP